VLDNTTTAKLRDYVRVIARRLDVPIATAGLAGIADTDSSSFKDGGIPAVTLHGLTDDWRRILHGPRDTPDMIKSASLYLGYVLTVNLLARLDGCECNAFR
jgi:hypothetical protein